MATVTATNAAASRPPITLPGAGEVACQRGSIAVTTGQILLNDIIELGILPANCVPVEMVIDVGDLDTNATPLITLDFGLDGGAQFLAASTVAQAGGVARPTLVGAYRVAPTGADRKVTVKIAAAAATAAAGTVGMTFMYRNAHFSA